MKIRTGFVSNSSSSSFCVIGVRSDNKKNLLNKLQLDLEKDYLGHGCYSSRDTNLSIYGDGYDFAIIGFEAQTALEGQTLKEVKKQFSDYMKTKYHLCIPPDSVQFLYGETGN